MKLFCLLYIPNSPLLLRKHTPAPCSNGSNLQMGKCFLSVPVVHEPSYRMCSTRFPSVVGGTPVYNGRRTTGKTKDINNEQCITAMRCLGFKKHLLLKIAILISSQTLPRTSQLASRNWAFCQAGNMDAGGMNCVFIT